MKSVSFGVPLKIVFRIRFTALLVEYWLNHLDFFIILILAFKHIDNRSRLINRLPELYNSPNIWVVSKLVSIINHRKFLFLSRLSWRNNTIFCLCFFFFFFFITIFIQLRLRYFIKLLSTLPFDNLTFLEFLLNLL